MNPKLKTTIFLFSFLLAYCNAKLIAQQSKVDSAIYMLNKSKTLSGLDTAAFKTALSNISNSVLNDAAIKQIEDVAKSFYKGDDENLSYIIKLNILTSLSKNNVYKAIDYGKLRYNELEKSNTNKFKILRSEFFRSIRIPYRNSDRIKEGFEFYNDKLREYKLSNDSVGIVDCYFVLCGFYRTIGLYDQSIYNIKKAISYMDTTNALPLLYFDIQNPNSKAAWLNNIGVVGRFYAENNNYREALKYIYITYYGFQNFDELGSQRDLRSTTAVMLANTKMELNETDSIEILINNACKMALRSEEPEDIANALQIFGKYKIRTGDLDSAEMIINQCKSIIAEKHIPPNTRSFVLSPDYYLALIRIERKNYKEAISFLKSDIEWLKNSRALLLRDYKLLAQVYELTGNQSDANSVYKQYIVLKNSMDEDEKKYRTMSFEVEQQMSENESSINNLKNENKIEALTKNYSIGIAVLLFLLAGGIYARFINKSKTAKLLQTKTNELELTLADLKATQQQLVQSEKLAAFGTMATRMAHEIQNPLNFVNNFSELSQELVDDIISAKSEEDKTEAAKTLIENLQKINHHGKRAGNIISQLQEHSNKGTAHEYFESHQMQNP